jgi:chitodextrinase
MTAGAQSGTTLAVDARTSDGQSIIAYIPTQRGVTIDMTKISDVSANAWWFNPQTASSTLAGTFPATGTRNFTSPDQNDWVLVIDSASVNLPAPGSSVYVSSSDTSPPSIPANLTATSISATQINLSWTASTDNVAVAGYQIFRNGSQIATSTAPSYSDTGLTAATAYTYAIAAVDAAGNVSGQSAAATATTAPASDSTPPAIISNTTTILWTTDEPATSQVEYGTTLAYGSNTQLDPTLLTSHNVVLTGLVPQTLYNYRIHSSDAAGNEKISANGQFMMVGSN